MAVTLTKAATFRVATLCPSFLANNEKEQRHTRVLCSRSSGPSGQQSTHLPHLWLLTEDLP